MNTIKTSLRSDKRVNPEVREYRILTNAECRNLRGHAEILDCNGKVARVKITSVKIWKTRSDIEVKCQFGLYEYFTVRLSDNTFNTELVTEVLDDEVKINIVQYCPECGDNRYTKGSKCINCDFPHHYSHNTD